MDYDSDSPTSGYEFVTPLANACGPNSPIHSHPGSSLIACNESTFQRAPDLYFPDGNIILEVGTTHFRVSRGILAARSPVFKEVLSLPQPNASRDAKVDGCDVVHLFGDDPQEVTYFLRAIYDSSFFEPPPTKTDIPTIAGILRLSTKYDVDYLRRRALKHLDTLYPLTLAAFDIRQDTRTTPWRDNTAFCVASLARELRLEWLMPPVLYCVCSCPAGDIIDGYIWSDDVGQDESNIAVGQKERVVDEDKDRGKKRIKLNEDDRGRCVRALVELGNREKRDILGFLTVDDVQGCETSDSCRKGRMEILRMVDRSRDFLDPLGAMDNRWDWYENRVCKVCAVDGRRMYDEERENFWTELPHILDLRDWDILAELRRDALYGVDS